MLQNLARMRFVGDLGGGFAAAVKSCCARTGGLSLVRATALAGGKWHTMNAARLFCTP